MKTLKQICCATLAAGMLLSGCSSMTNTGKGALIGGGGGGALGAGIGALIGGGKGAGIGAAIGAAVGAGAGALIGKKMDKQKAELEQQLKDAEVQTVTDQNGLTAIKVTFPGGILFPTNGTTLSANAQNRARPVRKLAQAEPRHQRTDLRLYRQYRFHGGQYPCGQRSRSCCRLLPGEQRSVAHSCYSSGYSYGRLRRIQRYGCRPRAEPPCGNLHYSRPEHDQSGQRRYSSVIPEHKFSA